MMRAMIFEGVGRPLRAVERKIPSPGPGQLLLRVHACGVCRTDLHLLDGEVEIAAPPRILGHQIIGTVEAVGEPAETTAGPPVREPRDRRSAIAWACRGSAGPDGECAVVSQRAREPVPAGALHRAATSTAEWPSTRSPTRASAFPSRRAIPTSRPRR